MKNLVLFFSVIIAVLLVVISYFLYPLIASLFDSSPMLISIILGIIAFVIVLILSSIMTKSSFIRRSVCIPFLLCLLVSFLLTARLGEIDNFYHNGYLKSSGDLYNSIGQCVINDGGLYYSKGVVGGSECIIGYRCRKDYKYEQEYDDKMYEYTLKFYDAIDYSFLFEKVVTQYYDKKENVHSYSYKHVKEIIEYYSDVTVYEPIG